MQTNRSDSPVASTMSFDRRRHPRRHIIRIIIRITIVLSSRHRQHRRAMQQSLSNLRSTVLRRSSILASHIVAPSSIASSRNIFASSTSSSSSVRHASSARVVFNSSSPIAAAPATPVASFSTSATPSQQSTSTIDGAELCQCLSPRRVLMPRRRTIDFGSGYTHLALTYSPLLQSLTITINRPELHNAFNDVVIKELRSLFITIESAVSTDPLSRLGTLRCVILTGSGASFSAGADLNWMSKMRTYSEAENLADSKLLFNLFVLLQRCPIPTIARVNGVALGGGVGLVAACDMCVAVRSAQFGLTEVKLGLSPAVISSFVLAKMPTAAANLYFMTGQKFAADEAMRHGLVNQVVDNADELDSAVNKIVEELAMSSPQAVRATKSLLRFNYASPTIAATETCCTTLIAKLRVSDEGQEGLNSFFDKRKPNWVPAHLGNKTSKKK